MSLDKLFEPDKVAVVGASRKEGKTGHEVFENLYHGFEGEVIPVNPNADEVDGVGAEDSVPEDTDLAVIVVPAQLVPGVLRDAGKKDVEAAIVISAGFSESGNGELEEELKGICRHHGITLLGPNVLGLINTGEALNASFASKMPGKGSISFMSQSGAFCTAVLDYAEARDIGFRHFVSLGNKAMLDESDLLEYWLEDDETETVLGYTEGIENGRKFIENASRVSREKPVIMIKSGRTDEGGEAASSHTGSMAGSYEAYQAAFRKAGVIEAESNRELLAFGRSFAYQPLPDGENVAVVTNAGGPGVITADEVSSSELELADLSDETLERLEEVMPDEATPGNPMDVIGDAGHVRYSKALEAILEDSGVDSVIVLLTPQANTEVKKTARTVLRVSGEFEKPVAGCFLGEKETSRGREILENGEVPGFQDPVDAVKVLEAMNYYRRFLERDETFSEPEINYQRAEGVVENLPGFEAREELLKVYGIDTALTDLAETPLEAEKSASRVGYPAVAKIESPDIHHKTDMDGLRKGLENREEVRNAFRELTDNVYHETEDASIDGVLVQEELEGIEVALGMKKDPQFGTVVMVGLGGIYVEALKDVSFGIAPVSEEEAERMIDDLRSHELFEGARGKEDFTEQLKDAIIRLGEMGLRHEEIKAVDINPMILEEGTALAADVEVDLE